MKNRMKICAWIMSFAMLFTMTSVMSPLSIKAEGPTSGAYYLALDGTRNLKENAEELDFVNAEIGTSGEESWYIVKDSHTVSDRIIIKGHVNLILADNSNLSANLGIRVSGEDNSLTIWAQSDGDAAGCLDATINANDDNKAMAAIGGDEDALGTYNGKSAIIGENITINGGNIIAVGSYGAGIGAGQKASYNSVARNITINGGHVVSKGAIYAAGIGAGGPGPGNRGNSYCSDVVINGGIVEAYGNRYGAGIGTGSAQEYSSVKNITINGGDVTAIGGDYAAGIGAAYGVYHMEVPQTPVENITINGGNVYAVGGTEGQGVGAYYGPASDEHYEYDPRNLENSGVKNFVITGGNVYLENMDGASDEVISRYTSMGKTGILTLFDPVRPKNAEGQTLEMVKIQLSGREKTVGFNDNIETGNAGIVTDKNKNIYLWLPKRDFTMPSEGNITLAPKYYYCTNGNVLREAKYTGESNYELNQDYIIKSYQTLSVENDAVLKLNAGKILTIEGSIAIYGKLENNGTVILKGGYYTDLAKFSGNLIIQGGSYEVDPSQYVPEGYEVTKDTSIYRVGVVKEEHKHSAIKVSGKAANCIEDGWKDYYRCNCNRFFKDQACTDEIEKLADWFTGDGKIPATGHNTELINTKATSHFEKGYTGDTVCKLCNMTISEGEEIPALILEATSFSSAKSVKKKTISLSWGKVNEASGYYIQYSTDKSFKKKVKKLNVKANETVKFSLRKLKSKTKYYIRIRSYKTGMVDGKSKTVYSSWSKAKMVKVK